VRKHFSTVIIFFLVAVLFSGCDGLRKIGLGDLENEELLPVSSIAIGETEAQNFKDKAQVHLYFASEDGSKLKLEIRYIPLADAKGSTNSLATRIVDELISGPNSKSGLKATMPKDSKQVSKVSIDNTKGVATVNLSSEFVNNHPGGIDTERLTIYSIVNSLTELKEIQEVSFLVNGEKRKEFKGNFQFDIPFPRTVSLISTDPTPTKSIGRTPTSTPKAAASGLKKQSSNSEAAIETFNNPQMRPEVYKGVPLE